MKIFPAIDLRGGRVVRLTEGDYDRMTVYGDDPVATACGFAEKGAECLHVVDLDGARAGHIVNYRTLETLATKSGLTIDFGGGLKQDKDLEIAFECGASMVTGGSIAVKQPATFTGWIERFGPERIILGADAKDKKIAISGWEEKTTLELIPFIKEYKGKGIQKVICTDIARDGMLRGASVSLYKEIQEEVPGLYLIASGGISSISDIEELEQAGIPAVIFGKAIYEGRIALKDLRSFIQ